MRNDKPQQLHLAARSGPGPLPAPHLLEPKRALCRKDYGPLTGHSRARWGGRGKAGLSEEHGSEGYESSQRRVRHVERRSSRCVSLV